MLTDGDRVRHRRDGAGVVLKVYARGTARCRMDTGKVMTYSQARLTAIPEAGAATASPPQPSRARARGAGTSTVDYALLERARASISRDHPDADDVVARVYQGRPYCEVWKDGHAWTVYYDGE